MAGGSEGDGWRVVHLDDDLFEPASEALNAAFFDDPLLEFLASDPERRRHLIAMVFPLHLRLAAPDGHTYVVCSDADEVAGTILLAPPGCYPPPPWRVMRLLPSFASGIGGLLPSLRSMLPGFRYLGATGRLHMKGPHWYVMMVGVAPRYQGHGAGRRLMAHAIELAEADGLPLYLETENEDNVGFYELLGFEVTGTEHPHPAGPRIIGMRRA